MQKRAIVLVILILSSALLASMPVAVKADARTITVPDDYPTIQAAIGNASEGETVFVKKGTYNETVTIDKSLSLIGEDSQETVLTGSYYRYGPPSTIQVTADNVIISGFTITGATTGILIEDSYAHVPYGCKIIGNNLVNNVGDGIVTRGDTNSVTGVVKPSNHIISGNNITGNAEFGIYVSSSNTTISGNKITGNKGAGIIADECVNVTISGNNISTNKGGLYLRWWGPFYIYGNDVTNNVESGIEFGEYCNNATIHDNNIANNDIGIQLDNVTEDYIGSGNRIHHNNISGNQQQVLVNPSSDIVSWDNGTVGNYWSGYNGQGNYIIDENNVDHYPLTQPVDISDATPSPSQNPLPTPNQPIDQTTPQTELHAIIAVLVGIIITLLAILAIIIRRKRPTKLEP